MQEYMLLKKDYEWLKKIINITTSIENLYKKLITLEINEKNNTEEYEKIINYLDIATEIEDKLYKEANLDFAKSNMIINYIISFKLPDEFKSDIENILEQNYDYNVLIRIINILVDIQLSDYKTIKNMELYELINLCEEFYINNINDISVYNNIELKKAFEKDIMNGFVNFLQDYIDEQNYNLYKEKLIKSKYNIVFINKNIEQYIKKNKFKIPKNFYTSSRFIADITQTNLEIYNSLKTFHGIKVSTKQISEIIEMNNIDYSNVDKTIACILRQCLMKSGFLLINEEYLSVLNSEFNKYITEEFYLKKHYDDDNISRQIILNCFKENKNDRSKIKEVYLIKRQN